MGNLISRFRNMVSDSPTKSTEEEEMQLFNTFRYPTRFRSNIYQQDDTSPEEEPGPTVLVVPTITHSPRFVDTASQIGRPFGFRRQSHPMMSPTRLPSRMKRRALREMAATWALPGTSNGRQSGGGTIRSQPSPDPSPQEEQPKSGYRVVGTVAPPSPCPRKRGKLHDLQRKDTGRFLQVPKKVINKNNAATTTTKGVGTDRDIITENGEEAESSKDDDNVGTEDVTEVDTPRKYRSTLV